MESGVEILGKYLDGKVWRGTGRVGGMKKEGRKNRAVIDSDVDYKYYIGEHIIERQEMERKPLRIEDKRFEFEKSTA